MFQLCLLLFECSALQALPVVFIEHTRGLRHGFQATNLLAGVSARTIGHSDQAGDLRALEDGHTQERVECWKASGKATGPRVFAGTVGDNGLPFGDGVAKKIVKIKKVDISLRVVALHRFFVKRPVDLGVPTKAVVREDAENGAVEHDAEEAEFALRLPHGKTQELAASGIPFAGF